MFKLILEIGNETSLPISFLSEADRASFVSDMTRSYIDTMGYAWNGYRCHSVLPNTNIAALKTQLMPDGRKKWPLFSHIIIMWEFEDNED